jgi:RNA polymerase sigma-70 factor (ECF subfamily)
MRDPTLDPGAQWMLAWQAGRDDAFEQLVEAYSGKVYSLLTRFLGRHPGREDLVQEVFLRVIRARGRYRAEARFTTWLYRIVFNLCVNESERGRGRELGSLEGWGDPEGGGLEVRDEQAEEPSSPLERADVVASVRSAIAELPQAQRMALVLAKYDEMPYAEIAQVMGSSEKAVKSLIHRARESLRARLAHLLEEDTA